MILLIDNYDSFVYNLARYVRELGETPVVRRHDALTVDEILAIAPSHIIISPGPCSPAEAGISTERGDRGWAPTIPILGVCLGHQCIGAAYGGEIVRAGTADARQDVADPSSGDRTLHGAPLLPFARPAITHWSSRRPRFRPDLEVDATSEDGEIMAVQQSGHPVYGVQFHPESVLTEQGYRLVDHFLHGVPATPRPLPLAADGALVPADAGAEHRWPRTRRRLISCGDHRDASSRRWIRTERSTSRPWGSSGARRRIVLKPFLETTTFRNVSATGVAVVNLTDDAMLFAQGAISQSAVPLVPATW